jgi:hypothetical protein
MSGVRGVTWPGLEANPFMDQVVGFWQEPLVIRVAIEPATISVRTMFRFMQILNRGALARHSSSTEKQYSRSATGV